MAPKAGAVTTKTIQSLLTRIGAASSGRKEQLYARLAQHILPSPSDSHPTYETGTFMGKKGPLRRPIRILSIDMGIRNFAYCVADVQYAEPGSSDPVRMNVLSWEKDNLEQSLITQHSHKPSLLPSSPQSTKSNSAKCSPDADIFSASVLSHMAYQLCTRLLNNYNPDIILIEQQRWRSAGGTGVLQWTIRVNTLEAMLWAVFHALKETRWSVNGDEKAFMMRAVDPKRAAHFWLTQHALAHPSTSVFTDLSDQVHNPAKLTRAKAEKKVKIAILRSWLAASPPSTRASTPAGSRVISFKFAPGLEELRRAVIGTGVSGRRRRTAIAPKAEGGHGEREEVLKKLDDVTDALLQGAAWVAWEGNRAVLGRVWKKWRDRVGKGVEKETDDGAGKRKGKIEQMDERKSKAKGRGKAKKTNKAEAKGDGSMVRLEDEALRQMIDAIGASVEEELRRKS